MANQNLQSAREKRRLKKSWGEIFGVAGIFGATMYLFTILVFAELKPDYSHLWNTISELNARGEPSAALINTCYTIASLLVVFFTFYLILKNNLFAKISGMFLMLFSIGLIYLSWFAPMDPWEGVRTARDILHNNLASISVSSFLISQIFAIFYFNQINAKKYVTFSKISILLSLILALITVWAIINKSEVINLSERGLVLLFLAYILALSFFALKSKVIRNITDF